MLLYYSLAVGLPLLTHTAAQASGGPAAAAASLAPAVKWPTPLAGTWSTKSRSTVTGPGFYNPLSDTLIEPDHTGISYSFTSDGYYEEAYYRALAQPVNPSCPQGMMQWQHGQYAVNATGSIFLTPIAVDGRQLISNPCGGSSSIYTRYNNSEVMSQYETLTDPYHNVPRLNLFQWDGTPLPPMYLVYSPPQMLPTTTLNPLTATATPTSKQKRSLEHEVPLNWKAKLESNKDVVQHINADRLWWVGLGMTGLGGLLYLGPRRMGVSI